NTDGRVIRTVTITDESCRVYNLEVEGLHNYFVTNGGLISHNGLRNQFNHYFQNSFVKALGKSGLRYGEESLGVAREMSKRAHRAFHAKFNAFLESINMRPGRGRSSRDIIQEQG